MSGKTYLLDLDSIKLLADCLCNLDGLKGYALPKTEATPEVDDIGEMVTAGHQALENALGADVGLVYLEGGE